MLARNTATARRPHQPTAGAGAVVLVHMPRCPGRSHRSCGLVQAVSQHTSATQNPVEHCDGVVHAPPRGTGVLVGVCVTVPVLVAVAVLVAVPVAVAVAVLVGVLVGVGESQNPDPVCVWTHALLSQSSATPAQLATASEQLRTVPRPLQSHCAQEWAMELARQVAQQFRN